VNEFHFFPSLVTLVGQPNVEIVQNKRKHVCAYAPARPAGTETSQEALTEAVSVQRTGDNVLIWEIGGLVDIQITTNYCRLNPFGWIKDAICLALS